MRCKVSFPLCFRRRPGHAPRGRRRDVAATHLAARSCANIFKECRDREINSAFINIQDYPTHAANRVAVMSFPNQPHLSFTRRSSSFTYIARGRKSRCRSLARVCPSRRSDSRRLVKRARLCVRFPVSFFVRPHKEPSHRLFVRKVRAHYTVLYRL